jgi:hypothetical protein
MAETENRVAAILSSPIGCEFLHMIEQAGLTPETVAVPQNSLWLAALAVENMEVWDLEHADTVARSLANAEQLSTLAHSILAYPGTSWWFESVDLDHQVWISHQGQPPDPADWQRPGSPPGHWERYAQKPRSYQVTSTLHSGDSSLLVAYDEGVGDFIGQFPLQCWGLQISPNIRVYEVHNPKDWHELCLRYPAQGQYDSGQAGEWLVPDWGAASADWDGVHLSLGGLLTTEQVRYGSPPEMSWLHFWHTEQTFWLGGLKANAWRLPDREQTDVPDALTRVVQG